MSIHTTGTAALSDTIKTMYSRDLLMEAEPNLLHARFGTMGRIAPGSAGGGKTIEIRKFTALATKTGTLTEGVTPSSDDLTITKLTATAEQVGAFVEMSDLVSLVSYDPIVGETARLQGDQAGRTYDYRIREVVTAGTSVRYVGQVERSAITTSNILTPTEVKKAVRTLRKNNARTFPELGNLYAGIINPDTEYDLLNSTEFKDIMTRQPSLVDRFAGHYLGDAWGVSWFRSTVAKVFTGEGNGGIDVHATMIIGQGAYGVYVLQDLEFILKPVGSSGSADPLNQRGTQGWKGSFVAKILFDAYMVRIEHAVST